MENINSRILVTGGFGFIGTNLIKNLQKHGYKNITVIDIVQPRVRNVNFVKSDFDDKKTISDILVKTDYVFHLAAMVGVDRCRLDPAGVHRVNDVNTKNFIDLCVKNNVKRFVFSSSSEVYGNSIDLPYKEDAKLEPISEYAKSKIEVEKYLHKIQKESKMTVGIVRFFNVYGPEQRKDFVARIFVDNALNNKPLVILGNGNQTRCFTYVSDAVEGLFKVFKYNRTSYEIFNIGNPKEYSIKELAKIVLACLPSSKSNVIYEEYGNDIRDSKLEINRRVPAVTKAETLLNFKAMTPLKNGIENIIQSQINDEKTARN